MQQRYFDVAFALAGDQTTIPDASQPDGSMSFHDGYTYDYQRNIATDPAAKSIDRSQMNFLLNVITLAIQALQQTGVPEWITAAQNNGVSFPYGKGSVVLYSAGGSPPFVKYVSLINNNTDTPGATANWQVVADAISSSAQASAGTDNATIMTPARVAQQDALRALLNGSTAQVFNVAPATTNTHAVRAEQAAGIVGDARNLAATLAVAGSSVSYSWDELIAETLRAGNRFCLPPTAAATLNVGTTGAGGMDTGAAPASAWVAIYAIYNPTSGLTSLLGHAITGAAVAMETYAYGSMPSGYIYSALIGVWPTNASSQLIAAAQIGRKLYLNGATLYNAAPTNTTTPTALSVASLVPANAKRIAGSVNMTYTTPPTAGIYTQISASATAFYGVCTIGGGGVGQIAGTYDVPIVTAQTIYRNTFSSAAFPAAFTLAVYVASYDF